MSILPLAVFVIIAVLVIAVLVALVVLVVALVRHQPADADRPAPHGQVPPEARVRVEALLAEGQTVAAIKEVRQATSWPLVDAKNWVEALARGEQPRTSALDPQVQLEVETLASRGDLVQAVRVVRQHTGMGLSEATAYVRGLRRG